MYNNEIKHTLGNEGRDRFSDVVTQWSLCGYFKVDAFCMFWLQCEYTKHCYILFERDDRIINDN